jgi:hypothetical protein
VTATQPEPTGATTPEAPPEPPRSAQHPAPGVPGPPDATTRHTEPRRSGVRLAIAECCGLLAKIADRHDRESDIARGLLGHAGEAEERLRLQVGDLEGKLTHAWAEVDRLRAELARIKALPLFRQRPDGSVTGLDEAEAEAERLRAELAAWQTAHGERGDQADRLRRQLSDALDALSRLGHIDEADRILSRGREAGLT